MTAEPSAHLQFYSDQVDHSAPLLVFGRDDIMNELDTESELVRWLLEQMRTYDCRTQCIVGLIFDKQTVLSEVLRRASDCAV